MALDALYRLARAAGVLPAYRSNTGEMCEARPEILLPVLRQVGVAIERIEDADAAREALERAAWDELIPPCAAGFGGQPIALELRLPAAVSGNYHVDMIMESGEWTVVVGRLADLAVTGSINLGGAVYVARTLPVTVGTTGYHEARVTVGGRTAACQLIAAPSQAWTPEDERRARAERGEAATTDRAWGVFAPLYALRRAGAREPREVGDLGELAELAAWCAGLGGSFVGTLPLLASYLDELFEPSPYSPVSRRFWNELYLDPARVPGLEHVESLPDAAAGLAGETGPGSPDSLIDYRREAARRRRHVAHLAEAAWATPSVRAALEAFADRPHVRDYARFRAVVERRRTPWWEWAEPPGVDMLATAEHDRAAYRYHVFAQWAMDAQLAGFGRGADGCALYLDLPVGVHRAGYDTFCDRALFALDVSAGAPPDALFTGGQDWGLPPLVPRAARAQGHRYFAECVRAQARRAGMLRVDHAMGLHRLYWVPVGAGARDGVYVRYPYNELYAVLCLESRRARCVVIGEDLGTVPADVRPMMERRGLARLFVGQFSLPGLVAEAPASDRVQAADDDAGLDGGGEAAPASLDAGAEAVADAVWPPAYSAASLNTHDMPTFAGYWRGRDIEILREMGLMDEAGANDARAERAALYDAVRALLRDRGVLAPAGEPADPADAADAADAAGDAPGGAGEGDRELFALMRAYSRFLAASDATWVMINLEDLWLEDRPQNVPGTWRERPNWRRPMRRSLAQITSDDQLAAVLREVAAARRSRDG